MRRVPVAGLQVQYANRNVLSVKDWTWAREGMVIEQEIVEQQQADMYHDIAFNVYRGGHGPCSD